jgi:hypothetical protein
MASLATEASTWQRWKNSFRSSCTQERLGAPQLAAARHSLPAHSSPQLANSAGGRALWGRPLLWGQLPCRLEPSKRLRHGHEPRLRCGFCGFQTPGFPHILDVSENRKAD